LETIESDPLVIAGLVVVGAKTTDTLHPCEGAGGRFAGQLGVTLNGPLAVIAPKVRLAVPTLLMVIVCAGLVVFGAWLPKVRLETFEEIAGVSSFPPWPLRDTAWGESGASSTMIKESDLVPVPDGLKLT